MKKHSVCLTTKVDKTKSLETIIEELVEKRGKHSQLWWSNKEEAISQTKQDLKDYFLSLAPEEIDLSNHCCHSKEKGLNCPQEAYNQAIEEYKSNIEKA